MKLPDTIPTTAGIYALHNIDKDLYYVGSSKNIRGRILHHVYEFRHHTHYNKQMNTDFDTCSFEFLVLENVTDTTLLLNREHAWYLHYRDRTYNLGIGGRSGPMKGPYTLIDPTGKIYPHIESLSEFHALHKLDGCPVNSSLLRMVVGKSEVINGWRCNAEHTNMSRFKQAPDKPRQYNQETYRKNPRPSIAKVKYTALHLPSKTTTNIVNITQFCKDNNIPIYIVRGRLERNKIFTYFDWTISRV